MYVEELKLNPQRKQQLSIGTPLFPCMCFDQYLDQLKAGEVVWHWQPELEYFIVCEGGALAESENAQVELRVGEGVFISSHTMHRVRPLGKGRCRYYSILFRPELLYGGPQSILEQKYVRPILDCRALSFVKLTPQVPWMAQVLLEVERARKAFHGGAYGYELQVRDAFSQAWYHFARNTREQVRLERAQEGEKEQRIRKMQGYIYDHYQEPLGVADIAGAARISESECFRCFKREVGISPIDFLINHRIRMAAALLRYTSRSVTEVCYGVGFNNPSYFTKRFREIIGCTPRNYRRQLQDEERKDR